MDIIKFYSKEVFYSYFKIDKKKFEKIEDTSKYIISPYAPVPIIYKIGSATLKQFTAKPLNRFPITFQDTVSCHKITNSGLKTTKSYKFTWGRGGVK